MIFFPFVQSLLVLYSFLLNSCYVVLIPHGVINHGGDKPWCIHRERYSIRGRLENHLYYLRHVRVLSIKPCLHTQLPEHNRSFWKVSRGGGLWSPGMDLYSWSIWTAFRPREGGIWTKIFQKFKCPGGCLSFDLTGTLISCMTCSWHRDEEVGNIIVLESKLKQARCLPARAMDWINTRLVFNALWVDWQWNKNYPDWFSLEIALWTHMITIELWPVKPTLCYSMSRNPQVFLMVVHLLQFMS